MIFTAFFLLTILFLFSIKEKQKEKSKSFGSFYHTDIFRGIAVFLILISHIGDKSGLRYFTPLGGIGVSMFLISSGYGVYKSYLKNGLQDYFKKRFVGLFIPWWIVMFLFSISKFNSIDIFTILKRAFLIEVPSIFWYVQFIAMFYIAFYIAFKIFKDRVSIIMLLLFSIFMTYANSSLLLGEQSFAFIIGVLFAKYNIKGTDIKIGITGSILLFFGAVNLILKQTEMIRGAHYLVANLNGVMVKTVTAVGIFLFIYPLLRFTFLKIFTIAGKYSYELYLVHISLVGMLINNFTPLSIIMFIIISMVGAWLLNVMSVITIRLINEYIFL